MDPELLETIKRARGAQISAALHAAAAVVSASDAGELVEAAGQTLEHGHADVSNAEALATAVLAATRSVREPFGLQVELSRALVVTATRALPAASRMLEAMNAGILADEELAGRFGDRWDAWLFEYTMCKQPPPLRRAKGVSTADVVFAALELALSCASRAKAWNQWRFVMERVTEAPSKRGLPQRTKELSRKAIGFSYRLGIEQALELLKAGLGCADAAIATVIVRDAIGELEKCAPERSLLVQAAHDVELTRSEALALAAHLAEHRPQGASIATAALTWASDARDAKVAAALQATLGAAASKGKVAPSGKQVLLALGRRQFDEARALLDRGARMDDPGCDPDGAIHLLIRSGLADAQRFSLIEALLENGLSIDDVGKYGDTPLHAAALEGDHSLARFLVTHDADVDAEDVQSSTGHTETSLHAAAERGDAEMVRLLLEHGADPRIKNWNDETPLDVADDRVKALLRNAKKPAKKKPAKKPG